MKIRDVKSANPTLFCSFAMIAVFSHVILARRSSMTYNDYMWENRALVGLSRTLEHTSQWSLDEVGIGYSDNTPDKMVSRQLYYYPIRRLFIYGSEEDGWKQIHGVSIEDIQRVVKSGGEFKVLGTPD